MSKFSKIEFEVDALGFGHTSIDGIPIKMCRGVEFKAGVNQVTEVTLRLLSEVDGSAYAVRGFVEAPETYRAVPARLAMLRAGGLSDEQIATAVGPQDWLDLLKEAGE